jgi:hypothetical protein
MAMTNGSGVLYLTSFKGQRDGRLRVHLLKQE